MEKVNELVGKYGMTLQELQHNYELLMGRGSSAAAEDDYIDATPGQADEATLADYAVELAKYSEIANELAGLTPEEYASRSMEERLIDSVLYQAIEYYYSEGGTKEALQKYPNFKKLDLARSRKINEAYVAAHPEFNM